MSIAAYCNLTGIALNLIGFLIFYRELRLAQTAEGHFIQMHKIVRDQEKFKKRSRRIRARRL
jgi:hypothetical protein